MQIRNLIDEGVITAYKIGARSVRVDEAEIDRIIENRVASKDTS